MPLTATPATERALDDPVFMRTPRTDTPEMDARVELLANKYADPDTARFAINDFRDLLHTLQQPIDIDASDVALIIWALDELRHQRKSYRNQVPQVTGHDACCASAGARQAEFDEQRAALDREVTKITTVITALASHAVRRRR